MRVDKMVRGAALLACVVLTAGLVAGCGAAAAPRASIAPPPSSPAEARSELARLEQQIDRSRRSLGLPARAEKAAADSGAPAAGEPALAFDPPPAPAAKPPAAEVASDREEPRQKAKIGRAHV